MKLYNSEFKKYAEEYLSLGLRMGYFDYAMAEEFRNKLFNLNVKIDNSLPGDAYCEKNNLTINNRIFRTGEEYKSLTLFHEFTHQCSNLHNDLYAGDKSLISKLKENAHIYTNTDYNHSFSRTKMGDVNNPYTYIAFGGLLIDEVSAKNVATEMVKMKFNKFIPFKSRQKIYGNHTIHYQSHFDYYGIGEELVDGFSKTLFMKNKCKNLNGLCKEIFRKNFVYDLIHQHYENNYAFSCLIEELAHFGVLCFTEEQYNGHLKDRTPISSDLAYESYFKLKDLIEKGRENRETIPSNIPLPSFME